MFLEAQFGPAIVPIEKPRPSKPSTAATKSTNGVTKADDNDTGVAVKEEPTESAKDEADDEEIAAELERLHLIGIPVPGLEIQFDKYTARVWLETLEVECVNAVVRDRVKAVVERAVETIAPFWESKGNAMGLGMEKGVEMVAEA